MAHFCTTKLKWLRTDWHSDLTDAQIRALQHHGGNIQDVYAHIDTFFDAYLINRINRVCVTINCQNPWPAVLAPLWLASGQDEEAAAMFLGNLYCRRAINRSEPWWSSPHPVFKNRPNPRTWTPRHYFIGPGPDEYPGKARKRRS
jgi:hypothetical protein